MATGTEKKVLKIIKKIIDFPQSNDLFLESNFNDIGISSVQFVKIVVEVEKNFNFEFDDHMLQVTNFNTIKSMIDYIESKLKELKLNDYNS